MSVRMGAPMLTPAEEVALVQHIKAILKDWPKPKYRRRRR